MTREQILSRFPRATEDFIRINLGNPGANPGVQNREARDNSEHSSRKSVRPNGDKPRRPKAHGRNHPRYRITVTLHLGKGRSADPDGQLSTILDCFVRAVKRLGGVDFRRDRES